MKRFSIILFVVILVACSQGNSDSCSFINYKNNATAVMKEFQEYIQTIDLNDPQSYVVDDLNTLKIKAEYLECADRYPLKQETLEKSIEHMIDVVRYVEDENYSSMQTSLNRVELNVERFYDWSVDID